MKLIRQFRMFGRPVQLLLLNLVVINTGFYMLMPYLSSYLGNTRFHCLDGGFGPRDTDFQSARVVCHWRNVLGPRGLQTGDCGGCALRMVGFLLFGYADALSTVLVAALLSGLGGSLFRLPRGRISPLSQVTKGSKPSPSFR